MEGIVQRMKYSYRVVLTLDSIMQSFAVEVDDDELEILAPQSSVSACSATSAA
jgi:hypothetical protein